MSKISGQLGYHLSASLKKDIKGKKRAESISPPSTEEGAKHPESIGEFQSVTTSQAKADFKLGS